MRWVGGEASSTVFNLGYKERKSEEIIIVTLQGKEKEGIEGGSIGLVPEGLFSGGNLLGEGFSEKPWF